MSIDSLQRELQRRRDEVARLQQQKAAEASKGAQAQGRAASAAAAARKASSTSTALSKARDADRYQADAARSLKSVADLESKIARAHKELAGVSAKLAREESSLQRKTQQDQARHTKALERSATAMSRKVADHDRLHAATIAAVERLQRLPEQIVVLFLASNPRDLKPLSLDEEVRSITEMIRKSDHRDAVRLESRWAQRPLDLLQALNELRPRVVHFSGHGNEDNIAFQDDSGSTKLVSTAAIVSLMAAAASDIQLVFFNTCKSQAQAEAVVAHVPAAIGMTTLIGDHAARVFSAQFYSAIGFGLSVNKAFAQARTALLLEGITEESTPRLFLGPDVDGDQLVMVRPAPDPEDDEDLPDPDEATG